MEILDTYCQSFLKETDKTLFTRRQIHPAFGGIIESWNWKETCVRLDQIFKIKIRLRSLHIGFYNLEMGLWADHMMEKLLLIWAYCWNCQLRLPINNSRNDQPIILTRQSYIGINKGGCWDHRLLAYQHDHMSNKNKSELKYHVPGLGRNGT